MSEPTRVAPARRRGLADEVADRVRDAIFDGSYPPGTQLREANLSAELEVSRGPVREALMRLEAEGLVRSAWHRGATVTELSADDIAELDSLRGALENLAVGLVAREASQDDLAAVEAAARRMERAEDEYEMAACDIAFHDAIYLASGHRRVHQAWEAIRCQVHLFLINRIRANSVGYLEHLPGEHADLVAALRTGDAVTAVRLFAEHRQHAIDVLSKDVPPVR
ncbi:MULTISPECIES: GntR family transcriptional regulator [Actinoalloteichus]|uniref:Transcriptional regulator n=1 Tax=Actinoalloteichus fjordicus TaxID=1612552 RepID=A0AAC9LD70_9PSEU|nr:MULTISPECIES: GntR family transcriptional regulator [Actinoalloteichus]APU15161.1 transcriptional regulator [Actinoalloteichus fjordicus]APU21230.1 transcriptional regulator [Actinoalloteichus sp. GBA129-24]